MTPHHTEIPGRKTQDKRQSPRTQAPLEATRLDSAGSRHCRALQPGPGGRELDHFPIGPCDRCGEPVGDLWVTCAKIPATLCISWGNRVDNLGGHTQPVAVYLRKQDP